MCISHVIGVLSDGQFTNHCAHYVLSEFGTGIKNTQNYPYIVVNIILIQNFCFIW